MCFGSSANSDWKCLFIHFCWRTIEIEWLEYQPNVNCASSNAYIQRLTDDRIYTQSKKKRLNSVNQAKSLLVCASRSNKLRRCSTSDNHLIPVECRHLILKTRSYAILATLKLSDFEWANIVKCLENVSWYRSKQNVQQRIESVWKWPSLWKCVSVCSSRAFCKLKRDTLCWKEWFFCFPITNSNSLLSNCVSS